MASTLSRDDPLRLANKLPPTTLLDLGSHRERGYTMSDGSMAQLALTEALASVRAELPAMCLRSMKSPRFTAAFRPMTDRDGQRQQVAEWQRDHCRELSLISVGVARRDEALDALAMRLVHGSPRILSGHWLESCMLRLLPHRNLTSTESLRQQCDHGGTYHRRLLHPTTCRRPQHLGGRASLLRRKKLNGWNDYAVCKPVSVDRLLKHL